MDPAEWPGAGWTRVPRLMLSPTRIVTIAILPTRDRPALCDGVDLALRSGARVSLVVLIGPRPFKEESAA